MQKGNQVACIVCAYERVSMRYKRAAAKPLSLFRQYPEDVPETTYRCYTNNTNRVNGISEVLDFSLR